ncbi:MAG: DUF2793 domain-containing protein [Novosphingobium sp.]|nr:DUF2793 domain-containing protein [Novosphingobium sp.]
MSDPIPFEDTTPRLELPLLFAAQAQKEFTVNEALLRADLAIQSVVEDELAAPPAAPAPGQAWLVGSSPGGAFAGHAAAIAGWTSAGWRFVQPASGWRVYDKSTACFRHFDGAWRLPDAPAAPTGGATIDVEARAALGNILVRLAEAGIFSAS